MHADIILRRRREIDPIGERAMRMTRRALDSSLSVPLVGIDGIDGITVVLLTKFELFVSNGAYGCIAYLISEANV